MIERIIRDWYHTLLSWNYEACTVSYGIGRYGLLGWKEGETVSERSEKWATSSSMSPASNVISVPFQPIVDYCASFVAFRFIPFRRIQFLIGTNLPTLDQTELCLKWMRKTWRSSRLSQDMTDAVIVAWNIRNGLVSLMATCFVLSAQVSTGRYRFFVLYYTSSSSSRDDVIIYMSIAW